MKKNLFIILFSILFYSSAKEKNDSIKNIFKDNYNTYKKDSIVAKIIFLKLIYKKWFYNRYNTYIRWFNNKRKNKKYR